MQTQTSLDDSAQFTDHSVHRYEIIFGTDFVSTGGLESTQAICKTLGLKPGTRVLDVGSGLGGSAFHMATEYGAHVTGVDLLQPLVSQAQHRAAQRGIPNVNFIHGNIIDADLPEGGFDLIYSRDAIMYNEDKAAIFARMRALLAPGGRLFISDYGRGEESFSTEFGDYVAETGYYFLQREEYAAALDEAGFTEVSALDVTDEFVAILECEMLRLDECLAAESASLDAEDRTYLINRWQKKIDWCCEGQMRWFHLHAQG